MVVDRRPPPEEPLPAGAPAPRRSFLSIGARLTVSAAVVTWLLLVLDTRQIGAAITGAYLPLLALLLGLTLGERAYSGMRWYQLLRWNGANVPMSQVLRITFISAFAGLSLPGAVGTEAFRIIGLARYTRDAAMAFSSVLVDRLLTTVTLVPFVFLGLALAPPGMPDGIRMSAWAVLAAALGLAFVTLHAFPRRWADRLASALLGARASNALRRLYGAVDAFRRRPRMLMQAVVLAVGFQLLRVLVVWVSARAVGIEISPAYFFIFTPAIVLLTMAPISFVGVGVREAAYVYLFSLVAVAPEQAFAASVLVLATGLLSSLPGAWLLLATASGRRKVREGRRMNESVGDRGHGVHR